MPHLHGLRDREQPGGAHLALILLANPQTNSHTAKLTEDCQSPLSTEPGCTGRGICNGRSRSRRRLPISECLVNAPLMVPSSRALVYAGCIVQLT